MHTLSRRDALKLLAASGAASCLSGCGSDDSAFLPAPGVTGFVQPPVQAGDPLTGTLNATLTTRFASNTIAGKAINTRTYEGRLVGPTLRVRPGQTLQLLLNNEFPPDNRFPKTDENIPHDFNTTNIHTHGLHVSPEGNSDNIFLEIPPQTSLQYEFRIPANHPSGTFFYHPHKHGSAAVQMFSGMAGALIIEGALDQVPEVAAARDLIYLINELSIDPATGQVPDFTGPVFTRDKRILTVNGEFQPRLTVRSGEVVRLRLINATVQTSVPLAIDGHELAILAHDGITLPAVKMESKADLAVANRADVLVRGGSPGVYAIKKLADNGGMMPDPEVILGHLEVLSEAVAAPMNFPTTLPAPLPDITVAEVVGTRTLTFERLEPPLLPGAHTFTINSVLFDPNRIDHTLRLGTAVEWIVINRSEDMHPLHIHTNPFQVIEMNGMMMPRPEWRDTVHVPKMENGVPGMVRLRQRFTDFAGKSVLHCHNVVHEDLGMMQAIEFVT